MSEKLAFQPPHQLNKEEKQFLASVPQKEKELYELATEMLGSSHFTGKTHGFKKWKISQVQQPPGAK